MAKYVSDSFLASGAVEHPLYPQPLGTRSTSLSPLAAPPRSFPPFSPSYSQDGRSPSPRPHAYAYAYASSLSRSSSQRQDGALVHEQSLIYTQQQPHPQLQPLPPPQSRPLSPPVTRVTGADSNFAAQIQSWRLYTKHLRENAQGERAHMEADRARMEEVMAEERALWDQERDILKERIEALESQVTAVAAVLDQQISPQAVLHHDISVPNGTSSWSDPLHALPRKAMTTSGSVRTNGSSAKHIPQESGRNPDGSPFYAPAAQHPSRTFEATRNNELRVDSMAAPRETPLRVTSKELTQSDFGLQSPPTETPSRDGSVSESIDISLLQPELEGVSIKASAVAPTYVVKVLSPKSSSSPSKSSSPPGRTEAAMSEDGLQRSGSRSKKSTLELIAAPENRRLTMNAGHTPNHSVHKIEFEDSGNATPTQSQILTLNLSTNHYGKSKTIDENIDPDPELRGPLGLKNDPPKDELFLAELTNKLEEVKQNGSYLPTQPSVNDRELNGFSDHTTISEVLEHAEEIGVVDAEDDEGAPLVDEAPVLKVKPSMNFGRPFGSL